MKRLLALALPLLALAGCDIHTSGCHYHNGSEHCHGNHHNTPVVASTSYYDEGTTNILVVEEDVFYPTCSEDQPFYHDANWCTFDGVTCCAWSQVTNSIEHVYCYYDYCGWELVEVNEYY